MVEINIPDHVVHMIKEQSSVVFHQIEYFYLSCNSTVHPDAPELHDPRQQS